MKSEQLTAWALNELSPEERASVEAALAQSPQAAADAKEMQDFCAKLSAELGSDPVALRSDQREALLAMVPDNVIAFDAASAPKVNGHKIMKQQKLAVSGPSWRSGWTIRFAAIAACALFVGVVIHQSTQAPAVHGSQAKAEHLAPTVATAESVKINRTASPKTTPAKKLIETDMEKPAVAQNAVPVPTTLPLPKDAPSTAKNGKSLVAAVPAPDKVSTLVPVLLTASSGRAFAEVASQPVASVNLNLNAKAFEALRNASQPPKTPGRTADLINSFAYNYTAPAKDSAEPVNVSTTITAAPWEPQNKIIRVALKARSGAGELAAQGVKLELAFNPAVVRSYRVLGYESNEAAKLDAAPGIAMAPDAALTALIEVVPVTAALPTAPDLASVSSAQPRQKKELPVMTGALPLKKLEGFDPDACNVVLHYQVPAGKLVQQIVVPVKDSPLTLEQAGEDFQFAAAVAGAGLLLHNADAKGTLSWDLVRKLAVKGQAGQTDRKDFVRWIDQQRALTK